MKRELEVMNLDIDKYSYMALANITQMSDVIIKAKLFNNGKEIILNGQTITLGGKSHTRVLEQTTDISIADNIINIDLKNDFVSEAGKVEMDLTLKDSDGQLTTAKFLLNVTGKILSKDNINAEDKLDTIEYIVREFSNKADSAIGKFNSESKTELDNRKTEWESLKKVAVSENNAAMLQDEINKTNSQLSDKASKIEVDIERKRIDNIAHLPSGSTNGDAELADIRVGSEGEIYSNAGNSVRGQVGKIDSKVKEITDKKIGTNIFDKNNVKSGYFAYNTGVFYESEIFSNIEIEIKSQVDFTILNLSDAHIVFKQGKNYLSGVLATADLLPHTFRTPVNCNTMIVSLRNSKLNVAQINLGIKALPYENYSEEIILNNKTLVKSFNDLNKINIYNNLKITNVLTVKKDGTGDFSTIREAIESIRDNSKNNRYLIEIYEGVYDLKEEYTDIWGTPNFIGMFVPEFTKYKGIGNKENVILIAKDSVLNESLRIKMATLNLYQTSELENLTVDVEGLKYAVHDDFNSENYRNEYRCFKNCIIKGKPLTTAVWGAGVYDGTKTLFQNCLLETETKTSPMYIHTNKGYKEPPHVIIDNCRMYSYNLNMGVCYLLLNTVKDDSSNVNALMTIKGTKVKDLWLNEENPNAGIRWKIDGYCNEIKNIKLTNTDGVDYSNNIDLVGTVNYTQ